MRVALFVLLAACTSTDDTSTDTGVGPAYPLDDVLRVNHLQAKGTHNSYHVETVPVPQWQYTHAPLGEQLESQGVRQLELDVNWDDGVEAFAVFHVALVDAGTTCDTLVGCLAVIKGWSDDHPGHHPVLVLIEMKDGYDAGTGVQRLAALDAEVLSVWPEDRLVTPALVRGESDDLRTALVGGWPTLGEVRGRALLVLHDDGGWRDAYADGPLFRDGYGDTSLPFAAYHSINDPFDARIAAVVDAGHLVRTRCDVDGDQARAEDTVRRDQALASGAHFLSTDFPAPVQGTSYWVDIPGGTPSRCNPRVAPQACTSEAVEDLVD